MYDEAAKELGFSESTLREDHRVTDAYDKPSRHLDDVSWSHYQAVVAISDLTLDFLNQATQAWVEIEYNRATHREILSSPVERFAGTLDVLRSSPSSDALRKAFRLEIRRRHGDGTILLDSVRFESRRRSGTPRFQ